MRQRAVAGVMPAALFLVWLVIGCGSSAAPAASPKPAGTESCAGVVHDGIPFDATDDRLASIAEI